jgi:hypothetical protein
MATDRLFDRVTQLAQHAAIRLHVRSALNPLLWLVGICTPFTFMLAYFSQGVIQGLLLGIGALPIVMACAAYVYWMLVAPDRLHSEDYQLRRQALQLIYEKGSPAVLATSVVAITNPEHPQLEEHETV